MAAISVAQIVKESLLEIKNRHLMLTPENYTEVYNEICQKYGFTTADTKRIQQYISRLSGEFKQQASAVNINTIDEFIAFVISRLNRSSSQAQASVDDDPGYKSLNAFTRRVLQVISMLHNKDAKNMAEKSMQILSKKCDVAVLDDMREKWFELISSYNTDYLDFLKYYGVRGNEDLKTMMSELESYLTVQNDGNAMAAVAELIAYMLKPSISKDIEDDMSIMISAINTNPTSINSQEVQDNIKNLVDRRIEDDKNEVSQKIASLNSVLGSISTRISEIATSSKESSKKVQGIKSDIKDINLDTNSFEQIKNMLFNIANALEIESRELGAEMSDNQVTISELQERINLLERELEHAKLESREDFLTKTATKRALMDEIRRIEDAYKRYGTDYSICFLDIDFFKKINDTFGHDAGDAILATVAMLFKKNIRKIDFIGRYGGEEFIVLLPNTALNDALVFAEKLRRAIESFKFIYKDERIKVTVSVGVATRSLNLSDSNTIEAADKMLYNSKQNGRNQVSPKLS
ncbi:GGDEF domain-containing protein [Campylobacter mucosalis]|uniref:diguanylate cyclase n=1 Tax=Campylobacter mucosalis CCUG 21559 TaxID=1032067 RepID=A0A6G5QI82_9BACT|nr:GGDEF domain-containing protein [Campylobacter mucosalis]QCD45324.1 diguanylate cyclase [Campylobacter mucosalis CCUG 21559]